MPTAEGTLNDVPLLFVTRVVRLLAYGSMSVVLVLYLDALGLSEQEIGVLLTMTLLGDTAISLWITTAADRAGRKRMLILGAVLMVLGGIVFALTSSFAFLLAAATIGVLSPSGNEVGPFLAIEQAALAQNLASEHRTQIFAWYHLAGSLATAAGSLACGGLVGRLQARGIDVRDSYRAVFFAYAAAGVVLAILFLRLSRASEAPPANTRTADRRGWLGLHRSRKVVLKLSALFGLDAFAGGFVLQSIMAYWFHVRFDASVETLGGIFFAPTCSADSPRSRPPGWRVVSGLSIPWSGRMCRRTFS